MKPGDIAPNFTWLEFLKSTDHPELGRRCPKQLIIAQGENVAMKHVTSICETIWTLAVPIRTHLRYAFQITSGYRLHLLNEAVGGSLNSQHMRGQAFDGRPCPNRPHNYTDRQYLMFRDVECINLFDWCKVNLKFGQLIFYGDPETSNPGRFRIHISTPREGKENGEVLIRSAKQHGR